MILIFENEILYIYDSQNEHIDISINTKTKQSGKPA